MNPQRDPFADEHDEQSDATVPLTAEQAAEWRKRHPALSPWRVVAVQAAAAVLATLVAALLAPRTEVVVSTGYGALCALLPAALFAHGLTRSARRALAGGRAAPAAWMVWELAKLALSLAMLALAPVLVAGLSWLALLAGMVVTMKAVWLVLLVRPASQPMNRI